MNRDISGSLDLFGNFALPDNEPTLLTTSARLTSHSSFTERYVTFFQGAEDLFEVQRGLNNCFAHDLVPAPSVIEAALRASRRGVKEKVENKSQYQAYLDELKPVREELGITLKEELYDQ
ncbi:cytochrome-c oxidase chain VI [Amanita rubescens]|nr:cytochrome-c oxidase chain VI [Amanita rubescens]